MALQWLNRVRNTRYIIFLFASAAPVAAQQPANVGGEIIVTGQRGILGAKADRVINEDEISTYGLSSIDELLDEIARERGSGREEIVYLIDGQRVIGLGDISAYPTEAINRIEILPKRAAAKLGGSPSQQAINISLKTQLRSFVGQASMEYPTDGGYTAQNGEVSVTDITRPRRINLSLRWRSDDALLESERNVIQAPDARTDLGRFRSLRPEISEFEIRGSVADQLTPNLNGFITARLFDGKTHAFLGRDSNGNQLLQRSRLSSGNIDVQLNGELGTWLLASNSSYSTSRRRTITDNFVTPTSQSSDIMRNRASIQNASAEVNATRAILDLPAGQSV